MALSQKGHRVYGETQADLPAEIVRYSRANGYEASWFHDAVCICGAKVFRLLVDDTEGVAVRACTVCRHQHPIGDSAAYLADATLEECECPCGNGALEVTAGVAVYTGSEDVRWLYLGCRCPSCNQVAVYADWKNEFSDYRMFLSLV